MNRLKAVFWDVDGTMAETELGGHRKSFNLSFKDFKLDWYWDEKSYIELLNIAGGYNRIKYYSTKLGANLSSKEIVDIHKLKQIYYKDLIINGDLHIRPGVKRLINQLYSLNIDQWIVTTSSKVGLDVLLEYNFFKERDFFRGMITNEDVKKHKPDPSAYIMALNLSKWKRSEVLVIEDSLIGLKAAKSAGLRCLITLNPWEKYSSIDHYCADSVVDHLGEESQFTKSSYGPSIKGNYVDNNYLEELLN